MTDVQVRQNDGIVDLRPLLVPDLDTESAGIASNWHAGIIRSPHNLFLYPVHYERVPKEGLVLYSK
jgi:hypothetical protein